MTRYQLTAVERETTINFNNQEQTASVYSLNRPFARKLKKLAESYPEQCTIESYDEVDGEISLSVPKSWVKIYPPRKRREMSDEQKAAAVLRLNSARQGKKRLE